MQLNKEDSAQGIMAGADDGKGARAQSGRVACRLLRQACLVVPVLLLSACGAEPSGGDVNLNEPGGLLLARPGFLTARAIDETMVEARVSVNVDGVKYLATQLSASINGSDWQGEVFVPLGSDANLRVEWIETGVGNLPAGLNGELLLASYTTLITDVEQDQAITLDVSDYVVESTAANPRLDLDIDADGFGNLQERLAGSDPNDRSDMPVQVDIHFTPKAPVIDGRYDSLWNTAQYFDTDDRDLLIDKVLLNNGVIQPDEADRRYRWAGMHDGQFLYLMVFTELSGAQTPFGDSPLAYDDDAIDIFLDGNNSKGSGYDGVDDYHVIIPLLSRQDNGNPNNSMVAADIRFELGDRSTPIDVSAFEFATCICNAAGEQQIYEVRVDLQQAGIPVGESFGLEIQLNNDVNGGVRDAKWAWHNDTGEDDTWRFPIRMGTARLEPEPQ